MGESDALVRAARPKEEAGCRVNRLEPIATFYPSAGACSEQIRLFIGEATATRPGTVQGLDTEHEDILVHQMPRALALDMLDRNEINNGHTLIALAMVGASRRSFKSKMDKPVDA